MHRFRVLLLLATFGPALLFLVPDAMGCPFCDTEVGKQVEAGIFNANFGRNALAMLLPFPILLAIVALIHFGLPWPRPQKNWDAGSGPDEVRPVAQTNKEQLP